MKHFLVILVVLLIPTFGLAGERPTPEDVKKVLNHYHNGHGQGVYLVDSKLCRDIENHACKNEVTSNNISKGEKTILWMNYFGPKDEKASIHYEFKNGGKTRKVGDFDIKGAYRYRTRIDVPSSRLGEWVVVLSQEIESGDVNLGSFNYTVKESE